MNAKEPTGLTWCEWVCACLGIGLIVVGSIAIGVSLGVGPRRPAPKIEPAPRVQPAPEPGPWLMGPESYEARWRRIAPEIYEDAP